MIEAKFNIPHLFPRVHPLSPRHTTLKRKKGEGKKRPENEAFIFPSSNTPTYINFKSKFSTSENQDILRTRPPTEKTIRNMEKRFDSPK
jgi:hypothetical protein